MVKYEAREKMDENVKGLVSHHGLKYVISVDKYENIKDDNNFIFLLEQFIEAMESIQSVICFFIALVLIFKEVTIQTFVISIGISYIIINYLSVKTSIYKIPFLPFLSHCIETQDENNICLSIFIDFIDFKFIK